jgi:hypothetical protein
MKTFRSHPYELFKRDFDTMEASHLRELDHLMEKKSYEARFKQTPQEKAELKKRMLNYPNKNHAPIPPNN